MSRIKKKILLLFVCLVSFFRLQEAYGMGYLQVCTYVPSQSSPGCCCCVVRVVDVASMAASAGVVVISTAE